MRGARKDGTPECVARAGPARVDGAQGGTWEACHLLGSAALDAYRGYTGQSRSRQPTHTWNTTPVAVVDHGGILADQREAPSRWPTRWPASLTRRWPLAATRGYSTGSSANGSPSTSGCWPPGPRTTEPLSLQQLGPPGRRELPGEHGRNRCPHGRPAGGASVRSPG